jgi:hypothetical protein
MKAHSIILNACLLISAGCLSTGYILGGYVLIAIIFLGIAIFWLFAKNRLAFSSTSSLLSVYIFLAALGVIVNLSMPLMVLGCTSALVSWDLTIFGQSALGNPLHETMVPLERYHLQSLAVAILASLLLIFISSYLNLQFHFGVMVFLVVIVIGCITYGLQRIIK